MRPTLPFVVLIAFLAPAMASGQPATRPATQPAADISELPPAMRARLQRIGDAIEQLGLEPALHDQIQSRFNNVQQRLAALRPEFAKNPDAARDQARMIMQGFRQELMRSLPPDKRQRLMQLIEPNADFQPLRSAVDDATTAPATLPSPRTQPESGDPAPPFTLDRLEGRTVSLASFGSRVVVLFFGSYTSPSFRQRAAEMETLREQVGADAQFLIIYTREAHPKGGWEVDRNEEDQIDVAQPTNMQQRIEVANRARAALKMTIPIAMDSMDDTAATAYGVAQNNFPNTAVVIGRNGRIVAYQRWADPMRLREAIQGAARQ